MRSECSRAQGNDDQESNRPARPRRGIATRNLSGDAAFPAIISPNPHFCFCARPMSTDYLKRILTSKVYDVAVESPLEVAPQLSARMSNTVLLKREDTQAVFSFKLRGAYNKMANLPAAALNRGVIAASAGNHAQGVALAASRLGCRAVIVMPTTSPK